ncbi:MULTISPECIES: sugar ABC transporter permease [Heyndrickxia]|uniref:Sugar ABC transporter permease n=1 Tax=Heyndrickxia oleronia TaxID=38875 RepID=A0A8E2I8Z2_9BACI|nr:sugar ABC transporter permease [Heyndrickxia oleronia]MBU5214116.1 sugar ABC transporter permease [Heyndrickxia oleronia]MCI1591649.1 sugar ABC transporter permease [Heyndrickxia oleronia]MCI1614922.1 sugar ABC transporter permease [Heyndrickxia oleronia]MCI1745760.1 sugar ABC transporter permease [Heyndrickxia oleronia]MCI1762836.1 sugar ABC transporter permease [Heyndrickxia oleronia]
MNRKTKEKWISVGKHIILVLVAIFTVYPVVWVFIGSLNPGDSLFNTSLFPKSLTFKHYVELFQDTQYFNWYKNTLKIAIWNMIISTFLVVTAAYAFSRFRFPGRKEGLMTMLVLQMFPGFMGMIAIYILLLQLGLLDNHWGLILVYAGGSIPFNAWLVKGYFDSMPKSLEEAAKMDGAGHVTIFFRVMMPLSVPILVFVAVSNFIGPWMDFIFARLVLRSNENKTLAIGLFEMVTGRGNTEFTTFAAGAVLVAIPITILFMIFQKYMVEGLKAGANK